MSSPVLLQILSQGSNPLQVQQYYEKIFDSISCVEHDKKYKFIIKAMISREGRAEEHIGFRKAVKVQGNIKDWLMDVLKEMQRTMKVRLEEAVGEMIVASTDLSQLSLLPPLLVVVGHPLQPQPPCLPAPVARTPSLISRGPG